MAERNTGVSDSGFQSGECSRHRHRGAHLATLDGDRAAEWRLRGERMRLRIAGAGGKKGVWFGAKRPTLEI